ncbi:MAG: hypothetical protein LBD45_01310 [Bacteroidales bacterium]|jgi:hypothetical protein|nr:hypothetical protein [Bacteroidales bacterium]
MKRCISIFLCLLSICNFSLQAQIAQYPVQVNTLVTQATPYVPQYYTGTFPRMQVSVNNLDFQNSTLQVYLRMKIESFMFSVFTPPEVFTPRYTLDAGRPLMLSGADLAVYFRAENMRISGNQSQFLHTKQLPDGNYRFHFEVYEAHTNRLLSNIKMGYAFVNIRLGEPPVLNFPENRTTIIETAIPNILFSWRPALNLPAGYNSVEYEFSLVEIYDKQVNPEGAFDYSRVLLKETVRTSAFIYNASYPMLIPGMRYAWRVRAIARDGIEEIPVIKNNGYSQVFWFDYAVDCQPVSSTSAVYDNRQVNISWIGVPNVEAYSVQYRKKGQTKWYDGKITGEICPLYNLLFGEEYEYRVGSRCLGNTEFVYTDVRAFRMPALEETYNVNCGIMPNTSIVNRTPAPVLLPGLPVMAGDFPVFITKSSGSNGRFSGEGYVGIPYLKNLQVAVTFNNILVNTANHLIEGYFETKYDPYNNMIVDIDQALTGGKGEGQVTSGDAKADLKVPYTINPAQSPVPIQEKDGHYTLTLTDNQNQTHTVEANNLPTTIEDASGATYEIDKNGTVKQLSSNSGIQLDDATKNTPRPDIATLEFQTTSNTQYALDQYKDVYAKVTEFFLKYKLSDEEMIASAKFMIPGASDEIFVKVIQSGSGFKPDKVHFVTDKGKEYQATYDATKQGWTVTLLGSEANDGQNLYVVQEESSGKPATLTRLNIYSYEPKSLKVRLVPVNGFTNSFSATAVSQQLNAIYNKVGITCDVEMASSFNYEPLKTKAFNVTGSGLFSTLTDDMKAINSAYMQSTDYQDGVITLFMIENVTGNEGVVGDMPRGKQFGYLFNGATSQTIAHEIGHGVFHLDHPFDRANAAKSFGKGDLSGNVMEYPPYSGNQFVKLQWDAIHAPGLVIGVFETDEGGMYAEDNYMVLEKDGVFFTPVGNPIHLSKGTKIYAPYIDYRFLPNWPVYIFETKNGKYTTVVNVETANPIFYGYRKVGSQSDYYNESINRPAVGSSVIVTLVKNRVENSYEILSFYESEAKYTIPKLVLNNRVPIVEPSVGTTQKIDESKPLQLVAIIHSTSGGAVFSDTISGKYSISITKEGDKYTTIFKLLGKAANTTVQGQKAEIEKEVENAINEKLNELGLEGKTSEAVNQDGFYVASMNGKQWIETVKNLGVTVWEEAALPKNYWKQDETNYNSSTIHTPSLFSGVSDGVIEEVTAYPQLVKLGYSVVTEREVRSALWNSVKNISISGIKTAATGAIKEKWDKYANSPDYITYHELGKDGVAVASMLYGGFAAKGKKLAEAVEESGEIIGKKARKFTQAEIDEYVKLATKNSSANKVMLGKYLDGGENSYISRAGKDHTYFDMGAQKWNEAETFVNKNSDEMWRINKQFIDEQKMLNKEFYLSLDPDIADGFYLKEINYLTKDLKGKIIKINNDLWKIQF